MIPNVIVVMGVSGCGKSTVAARLAERLGWHFAEADLFHPPANVDKMRSGVALNDDDRWPWLQSIAAWIDGARRKAKPSVVMCSALKRSYRELIIGERDDVALVYLKGDYALIEGRLAARAHAYMPASLLASQFAALEEPVGEEHATVVAIDRAPEEIVESIVAALRLGRAG